MDNYSGSTPKCQALFEKNSNFYAPRYPICRDTASAARTGAARLCRVVVIARMTQPNAAQRVSNLTGCISHRRGDRPQSRLIFLLLHSVALCADLRQLRQKRLIALSVRGVCASSTPRVRMRRASACVPNARKSLPL